MAERAVQSLHDRGVGLVVLHLDRDGAMVSEMSEAARKLDFVQAQTRRSAPRDVTGGGDAAIAGLVFGLLRGYPPGRAAEIGQIAAASVLESADGRIEAGMVLAAANLKS